MLSLLAPMSGFGWEDQAIYWSINEPAFVDGESITSFISPLPDDNDNWVVGRLVATIDNNNTYFDIYVPDGDINSPGERFPGEDGIWIGGGGDFWGTGGIGLQSIIPGSYDFVSASFAIELGINHWFDDGTEEGTINFELMAISDTATYNELRDFIYEAGNMNPSYTKSWNPIFYHTHPSVPEPSTALLTMIGLCLIGLMRKKRRVSYES